MDAIWGQRSKDIQIIEVIISEIFEVIDAPDKDYMPSGIAKNLEMTLNMAKDESAEYVEALKRQLLELPHQRKKTRVLELFDILKQYLSGERLVDITNEINAVMRKKLVTGDLAISKEEPKDQT